MNKTIKIIIAIIVIVLVVWGISSLNNKPSMTETELIKVGVILPLTGGAAKIGEEAKAALEIAQNDFSDLNIELLFEDDAFSPKDSVSAFNKINTNNVVAIIGPLNGTSIEAVRPLAVKNKLPLMTPYGAGNDMGDYLYKNSVEGADEAKAMADKANSLGFKKLAIIYLQNDFGLKYFDSFKKTVADNSGFLVAEESVVFGEKDFRTSLAKIKAKNPEALYIAHVSASVGEVAKQAFELGLKTQLLGQYGAESSDLLQIGGKGLEGFIYSFTIDESSLSEKQKNFTSKFEAKTGVKPQIVAYNTYDIYEIISQAVKSCGKDRECINARMGNVEDFSGVGGNFSITDGKIQREFFFKTVKNGQFVKLAQ